MVPKTVPPRSGLLMERCWIGGAAVVCASLKCLSQLTTMKISATYRLPRWKNISLHLDPCDPFLPKHVQPVRHWLQTLSAIYMRSLKSLRFENSPMRQAGAPSIQNAPFSGATFFFPARLSACLVDTTQRFVHRADSRLQPPAGILPLNGAKEKCLILGLARLGSKRSPAGGSRNKPLQRFRFRIFPSI